MRLKEARRGKGGAWGGTWGGKGGESPAERRAMKALLGRDPRRADERGGGRVERHIHQVTVGINDSIRRDEREEQSRCAIDGRGVVGSSSVAAASGSSHQAPQLSAVDSCPLLRHAEGLGVVGNLNSILGPPLLLPPRHRREWLDYYLQCGRLDVCARARPRDCARSPEIGSPPQAARRGPRADRDRRQERE